MPPVLLLVLGLVVLTLGAELLVRSASALAARAGISPLAVGLTVVAYGTSTPELVVSIQASLAGQPEIALGNVVGSNIFNVLFILGLSALIIPLRVARRLLCFDVPLMIALSVVVLLMAWNGTVARWEGACLVVLLLAYTFWNLRGSRSEETARSSSVEVVGDAPASPGRPRHFAVDLALVAGGLGLLVLGSQWFTSAAIDIARALGIPELVIGLTIVAAGTSLPEVATSILAGIRGERDIAVGNVVGSNLFNILGVLGLSATLGQDGIAVPEAALSLDIPVMVAVAFACLPIFFTARLIARWEGALFLACFIAYTGYLIVAQTQSAEPPRIGPIVLGIVLPLAALSLAVAALRSRRPRSGAGEEPKDC